MRESIKDRGRIEHMLEMTRKLQEALTLHTYEEVRSDILLFYGLSKMIEIIGEAAYKLTIEFKDTHTDMPWREIIGMRHILVHGYFTISPEMLWDVLQNDIPVLEPKLEKYLEELTN